VTARRLGVRKRRAPRKFLAGESAPYGIAPAAFNLTSWDACGILTTGIRAKNTYDQDNKEVK